MERPKEQTPGQIPDRHDAYLDWGLATGFRFVFLEQRRSSAGGAIGLVIEWNSREDASRAVDAAASESKWLEVPKVYTEKLRRVWALSVPLARVKHFLQVMQPFAKRIELAAPVSSGGIPRAFPLILQSTGTVLAAVLDDGCAFANTRFMQGNHTRVLWLWNQDPAAAGWSLTASAGPSPNCNFGYGGQWSWQDLDQMIAGAAGQQELIYAEAGLPGLRRAVAHGPHVMDLLAGREDWEVVFIQFPLAGIDDPTGRWLERYVVDGLNYIIESAGQGTDTIVVNLSWGPQTGPHDGSSPLEVAIEELIDEQRTLGRELIVALPAGNSYGARAHAQVDYRTGGKDLHWMLPPDGHAPAFLEIWWPAGVSPADVRLRIVPPSGPAVNVVAGPPLLLQGWFVALNQVGTSVMALLIVHPTEGVDPGLRGPHGQWTIEFAAGPADVVGAIDLYVARADHNMGARRRAKASYLTDDALEKARFVPPDERYTEAPGSAIRREGTLNGIATGMQTKVAAGYGLRNLRAAPYSSSGPSRGARDGPDFAEVTDRSAVVKGVRATGVRSGTTFRLVGTSTAAPQLGRQLAKYFLPWPTFSPSDPPERIGARLLRPDDGVIHEE